MNSKMLGRAVQAVVSASAIRVSIVCASLCCAGSSGPAHAGDWTQFYVGGGIGADVLTGRGQLDSGAGDTVRGEAPFGGDLGLSATIGADYQLNQHFVAGAFATYDWSNIDTSASVTDGIDVISANLIKIDQGWTVGGRLGVLATPSSMIYALLGYSWLQYDNITFSAGINSATFSIPDTSGWTVGGGFEHKLNRNVSLRGEYRYTSFDKETIVIDPSIGAVTGESQSHTARLVAAYRFGGSNAAADANAAPARGSTWSGGYIGGGVGVDAFVRELNVTVAAPTSVQGNLSGLGGGGFGGTLIAGYDLPVAANVIAGVFANYDWSNSDFKVSASSGGSSVSAELLTLDSSWTIGARLGMVMSNDVLVYGLAGYTRVQFDDASLSANANSVTLTFPSLDGVSFGGGFEKVIGNNLSLRAEYRYTALEDANVAIVAGVADMTIDSSMHSAKLMATYRFPALGTAP